MFKIPTFRETPANVSALKARVRELENVVDKYRTKRVGPYELIISIKSGEWSGICCYLEWMLKNARNCGPDAFGGCGSSSDGSYWSSEVKSNVTGGQGETAADLAAE